ncbi:Uncharacterised protein (modular protein) [Frankia canadensis]|uniref:Uncharacterized protein n=1 Tax=Frankia canadensis TaxID=1836972 RepID=A0A2I2KWC5_9ACTN|nr:Uncharacterised protein (modular protein) [Frankia canadensis]SOU57273.1 Uncharacterised protein (modular protein) [Frankia canadensis]
MPSQPGKLGVVRVKREPVRLHRLHTGPSFVASTTARAARFAAARRPYSRAHIDVRISVMSRTRSSSTSAGSTTSNSRPCAANTASTYSAPNRANRPRCSTTIALTPGSPSNTNNFPRWPFNTEPTSVTTRPTGRPCPTAHTVTRATCQSRSAFWSADDTRAYTAVTPDGTSRVSTSPTRIRPPTLRAGTRSVPAPGGHVRDAPRLGPLLQVHLTIIAGQRVLLSATRPAVHGPLGAPWNGDMPALPSGGPAPPGRQARMAHTNLAAPDPSLHPRSVAHTPHHLHTGAMCLAFLRPTGLLAFALLLAGALAVSASRCLLCGSACSPGGRPPPGESWHSATPSLAQLCVLRR